MDITKLYSSLSDEGIKLSAAEKLSIADWPGLYNVTPQTIFTVFVECAAKGKRSVSYAEAVIRNRSAETAEDGPQTRLEKGRQRIFQALGFTRRPTEAETDVMYEWLTCDLIDMDDILAACGKTIYIHAPNIGYVDRILQGVIADRREKRERKEQKMIEEAEAYVKRKHEERKASVKAKFPEIGECESRIRQLQTEILRDSITGSPLRDDKEQEIEALYARIESILSENGYDRTYHQIDPQKTERS